MVEWMEALFVTLIFIGYLLYYLQQPRKNLPPEPLPLPFIGNLIYVARLDPVNYLALYKISKKYGDIVSLRLGANDNILVSSCETAKELYARSDCLNRPINGPLWDRMLKQNIGMAFSFDEGWSNIRKFTHKALREYGFGNRNLMTKLIKDELAHLVDYMDRQVKDSKDGVILFNNFFQVSFVNLVASMVTGCREPYDSKELKMLVKASNEWFETPIMGLLTVMAFPWTRFICPGILGYTKMMNALQKIYKYARDLLEKHRQTNHFMENPACFTDSFLKAAFEHRHDASSIYTDDQFVVLFADLIQGGSDTTGHWMSFAILLLMMNPKAQEKVMEEIETVIGFDRLPESSDRESMTYTQAVIYEIHRHARLTVLPPPRMTTENFVYKGYHIKKGTTILVNLHSCFMDPEVWAEPEVFRPERFLNSDGELIKTDKMSITFGAGKRMCFGEPMARESSFLYLTTLLQKFAFHIPPPGYPTPSIEPETRMILTPKPFHCFVKKRSCTERTIQ